MHYSPLNGVSNFLCTYEEDAGWTMSLIALLPHQESIELIMLSHVSVSVIFSVIIMFIHFIYSSKRDSSFVSWCLSRDGSQPPQSNLWHYPRLFVTQRYEPALQLFLQCISHVQWFGYGCQGAPHEWNISSRGGHRFKRKFSYTPLFSSTTFKTTGIFSKDSRLPGMN